MITTGYKDIFISEDDFLNMIINDREQRQRTPIMHTDIANRKESQPMPINEQSSEKILFKFIRQNLYI